MAEFPSKIVFSNHQVQDLGILKSILTNTFSELTVKKNTPRVFWSGLVDRIQTLEENEHRFIEYLLTVAHGIQTSNNPTIAAFIDRYPDEAVLIYSKHVKLSENAYQHLSAWRDENDAELPIEFDVLFTLMPKSLTIEDKYYICIPLIHLGTINYLNTVKYIRPSTLFFQHLSIFKKFINGINDSYFKLMIFASTALSLYGIYDETSGRPRDLDFWFMPEIKKQVFAVHQSLSVEEKTSVDFYGIGVSKNDLSDEMKMSMTERLYRFFQMTANAGFDTQYRLSDTLDIIKDIVPRQKFQVNNNAGTGPFTIITIEDLLYRSECSVIAYGCKFLCLELEIFRKYLRYIDKCQYSTNINDICSNSLVLDKDAGDFKVIRTYIVHDIIKPREGFSDKQQYLNYLGIDEGTSVPIHSYGILTSVSNEDAYKLMKDQKVIEISRPSETLSNWLMDFTNLAFINILSPDIIIGENTLYRKTDITALNNFSIDTYTKKTDALSGLVYTHQKVFRNVALSSLPATPITSIYGDLASVWLWVLTAKGELDVMLVTSGFELINKHMALIYGSYEIVSAGELRVQTDGSIVFNIQSGTFIGSQPQIKEMDIFLRYDNAVKDYFSFNAGPEARLYYTDQILIPANTRPRTRELGLMCSGYTTNDRIYVKDMSNKMHYFTQAEFDHVSKRGQRACNYDLTKVFESMQVKAVDLDVSTMEMVVVDQSQAKINAYMCTLNIHFMLSLSTIMRHSSYRSLLTKASTYKIKKILSAEAKASASKSVIMLGQVRYSAVKQSTKTLYNNYVTLKISFTTSRSSHDRALEYELKVYELLREQLIKTRATPHIATVIAGIEGVNPPDLLSLLTQPQINSMYEEQRTGSHGLNVLVVEWLPGVKLADFITKERYNAQVEDLSVILFQIAWTLECMRKIGVQHNDLHANNVFIYTLKKPMYFSYFIAKDTCYTIKTSYIVKIYDFDRAYARGIEERNTLLDYLNHAGIYDRVVDSRYDMYLVTCNLKLTINTSRPDLKAGFDKLLTDIYASIGSNAKTAYSINWPVGCRPCPLAKTTKKCGVSYDATALDFIPKTDKWLSAIYASSTHFERKFLPNNYNDFEYLMGDTDEKIEKSYHGQVFILPGIDKTSVAQHIISQLH